MLNSLNVSGNPSLIYIYCNSNDIDSLDISANPALTAFSCASNQLVSLNVKNNNNTYLAIFNATSNPSLSCIQVDSVAYSNANWSGGKDAGRTNLVN